MDGRRIKLRRVLGGHSTNAPPWIPGTTEGADLIDIGGEQAYKTRVFAGQPPMQTALFDTRARRKTVSLTVNGDLYTKVRALGINASRVAEAALAQAVREKQAELLRAEIRQDIMALANYVAVHGNPAAELREMFDGPDAA